MVMNRTKVILIALLIACAPMVGAQTAPPANPPSGKEARPSEDRGETRADRRASADDDRGEARKARRDARKQNRQRLRRHRG